MLTVNKVILVWNVARNPVIKVTESWKKVALFTIATNRYFKTTQWEVKTESEFHNCTAWWSLAEKCEKYLVKWKLVYIEWRLRTRIIEKEDNSKIYKTEVVISNLIFLNKKSEVAELKRDDSLEEDEKF